MEYAMNTLNAVVLTTSVMFSATVHAALADEARPVKSASPEFNLPVENFIEGSAMKAPVLNTIEVFSSTNNALGDMSVLDKRGMFDLDYGVISGNTEQEANSTGTTFNALTVPNTFGMLLAGAGMIGFMVATRRKY